MNVSYGTARELFQGFLCKIIIVHISAITYRANLKDVTSQNQT